MGELVNHPAHVVYNILLIRHGETVDNVKGLYAGVRDSPLTSHGVQQASRLGQHLARQGVHLTRLFSSNLSRAVKTADIIRSAQAQPDVVQLLQLECLREQDFGFYEGKPFSARKSVASKDRKEQEHEHYKNDPSFQDVETKESMRKRAEIFVKDYLCPVINDVSIDMPCNIAVVSHGMLLSALWKYLLSRQSSESVTVVPDISHSAEPLGLEHLGGWSNTGYLHITYTANTHDKDIMRTDHSWKMHVSTVNKKGHLSGLRRTRGGVGSAQHDESQRSITSFFKKPKTS